MDGRAPPHHRHPSLEGAVASRNRRPVVAITPSKNESTRLVPFFRQSQIDYSHQRKVLRNRTLDLLLCLPKSSFGSIPRNPRLKKDAHAGTKRRLDDKRNNRDSGISGTVWDRRAQVVCFLDTTLLRDWATLSSLDAILLLFRDNSTTFQTT